MYYDEIEHRDCAFCGTTFHEDDSDLVFFEDIKVDWNSDIILKVYKEFLGSFEDTEHVCEDCIEMFLYEIEQVSEKQRVFPRMLDDSHL